MNVQNLTAARVLSSFLFLLGYSLLAASAWAQQKDDLLDAAFKGLAKGDFVSQMQSVLVIEQAATKNDVPDLVDALKIGNAAPIQQILVRTLGKLGDIRATKALIFELEHGEEEVKPFVITSLGQLKDDFALSYIFKKIQDTKSIDLYARGTAAMARIGSLKAAYALRNLPVPKTQHNLIMRQYREDALKYIAAQKEGTPPDSTEFLLGRDQRLYYKGLPFRFYQPGTRMDKTLKPWVMVCIHDDMYNHKKVYEVCKLMAKKHRVAVIAPVFNHIDYYDYGTFNLHGDRTDKLLIDLIEHVKGKARLQTNEIYMVGFGSGGDYVHRFAFYYPDKIAKAFFQSANLIAISNKKYFPLGTKVSPFAPDLVFDVNRALKVDMAYFDAHNIEEEEQEHVFFRESEFLNWYKSVEYQGQKLGRLIRVISMEGKFKHNDDALALFIGNYFFGRAEFHPKEEQIDSRKVIVIKK